MERVTDSWRANIARGARPRAVALSEAERSLALAAAAALEADVAGVDLLVAPDGRDRRARGQRHPGLAGAAVDLRRGPHRAGGRAPARRWSRRDAALVQGGRDQRAGGPGGLERAQVGVVAHAAAGVDRQSGQGRGELGHRVAAAARSRCPRGRGRSPAARARRARWPAARRRPGRGRRARDAGRSAVRRAGRRSAPAAAPAAPADAASGAPGPSDSVPTTLRATPARASAAARSGWWRRRRPTAPPPPTAPRASPRPPARRRARRGRRRTGVLVRHDGAQRPRDRHRLAPVDQRAAQRRVLRALPAAGVHDDAALEIEDRNDSHASAYHALHGPVIGLDIGGANTKAAVVRRRRAASGSSPSRSRCGASPRPWPTRSPPSSGAWGSIDAPVALTTTAELVDVFASKREGVLHVLEAARQALPGRRLRVITTAGELIGLAEAQAAPLQCAAANWMATALLVARSLPDAILLDCGGTTTDVIPIVAGRGRRPRADRRRAAARRRARLHGRAADQHRGGALARADRRRALPGVLRAVRDQRRRAPAARQSDP